LPVGVIPLEKYQGAYRKIKFHCFFCDNTYLSTPHDMQRKGRDCPRCWEYYDKTRYDYTDIKEEIENLTEGSYTLVSKYYKNAQEKINVKHNKCDKEYLVSMHNFRRGKRCPFCNESKGEATVRSVLITNGIEFTPQKSFEGLRYKKSLSYDFYLYKYNLLIEYQGEQHYHAVKIFDKKASLKTRQKRDRIKRDYANKAGITLLEIPYTVSKYEDIERVILKEIKNIVYL